MAASTSARSNTVSGHAAHLEMPVAASTTIYGGCWVNINSSGYLILAGTTASSRLFGLNAASDVDNSAGANGALSANVQPIGNNLRYADFDAVSPAQSWVGQIVYLTDDHTVAISGSNSIIAGMVVRVDDTSTSGKVVVDLLTKV